MHLPPLPCPAPSPRALRALGLGLAAALALYLAALAAASTDAVQARLRSRIEAGLRARLGPVELGGEVGVDPLLRVRFGPVVIAVPGERDPALRIGRVTVRASLPALLAGRLEPASIRLSGVRLRAGADGRGLRALAARLEGGRRGARGPSGPTSDGAPPTLRVRDLVVSLAAAGGEVEIGPFDADVRSRRDGPDRAVRVDARLPGGGRLRLDATGDARGWRGSGAARRPGPELVPARLRAGPLWPAGGDASLRIEAEGPADLSRVQGRVEGEVSGLTLAGERVGPAPVGPLRATASAAFGWDRAARRVELREGAATLLGAIPVAFDAGLDLGSPAALSVALRAERIDWRAAVAALPPALAPPPEAPRPAGTLDVRLEASGPLHAPAQWQVQASLDLARLREATRHAAPGPLAGPFLHRPPLDGGGRGPALRVGPPSTDFVPAAELPEPLLRAVTAAEDGGFFGHAGFDFDEIRNAVAEGAERGRVVRGGSTITQQLAKNLFLGPERTLARKVREAVITVGLEATLPKRRILEIYLNVVEWGPGTWGIGPAARLWFGKDARALSVKEAAFLASIIPSPTRARAMLARGSPSEHGEARVQEILVRMAEQHAIAGDVLSQAFDEPLVFAQAQRAPLSPPAPSASKDAAVPP